LKIKGLSLNKNSKVSMTLKDDVKCCKDVCCQKNDVDRREVKIDFLFLDLSTCTRCIGTDIILENALKDLEPIFEETGVSINLNKVNITNEELAKEYKFLSSPTIRVDGVDIQSNLIETTCESCGDICDDVIDCREWLYNGKSYTSPPKALIIEEIIKKIYCSLGEIDKSEYEMPENLIKFFVSAKKLSNNR